MNAGMVTMPQLMWPTATHKANPPKNKAINIKNIHRYDFPYSSRSMVGWPSPLSDCQAWLYFRRYNFKG